MSKNVEMKKVLIVDDDVAVTNYLMIFLTQTGRFDIEVVNDSRLVTDFLSREDFDVLLLDLDMPNVTGIDILRHIEDEGIHVQVVILTGVADVDLAVKCMKLGAFDYLTKPVDEEDLLDVIDGALEHRSLRQSIEDLPPRPRKEDLANEDAFAVVPSQNPSVIKMFHQAEKMASSDFSIFIVGELGTWKESLARAIHRASPRRNGPFVVVDACGLNPERFAEEFFGQERVWSGKKEKKAGFLEQAQGGTLFLGEVEKLDFPMQVRLLRVIQKGEFYREYSTEIRKCDVRFIVSSSIDPSSVEFKESFSKDLLYHLMVNSIRVPPLRERKDDIPLLCERFLEEEGARIGKQIKGISPEFLSLLEKYDFPDNLQELRNIIQGSVANEEGAILTPASLPPFIRKKIMGCVETKEEGFRPRKLEEVKREYVGRTLAHFKGDREKAAEALGISLEEVKALLDPDVA